jgi:hypothetical protein
MRTSEAEFKRVVRHEAGHTLGFDHEHMRSDIVKLIDRERAISFFDEDQGWTPEEVEEQVLTPLAKKSIMGTKEADPISIMCYQLPGSITIDGNPILGGTDINATDYAFAGKIYQKRVAATRPFDSRHLAATAGSPARSRSNATTARPDRSSFAPHSGSGKRIRARDHGRVSAEP